MKRTMKRLFSKDGISKTFLAYSNPVGGILMTIIALFLIVVYIPIILTLLLITGLSWLGLSTCYVILKNIMCLFLSFTDEEVSQFKDAYFKVIDRHLTRVTKKSDDILGV
jgi:hypothetical protein|tara:strand:+ start:121 stop:450 length:330 start_codon:yes stop_codon:yes gene_type:complete